MSAAVGAVLLLVAPTVLGTNPIVAENLLPGSPSTEWDVNGAGNPDVEGFSTRASLLPGATVAFKVKTSRADEDLRIDIYRMGWYSGNGARLVGRATIVDRAAAASQPACPNVEPDAPSPLWDCGLWSVVAEFALPSNATSGLYVARAVLPTPDTTNWRMDASPKKYDPHHAVEGADPAELPAATDHAYGGAGRRRRATAEFALREPRATHMWFVVRALPSATATRRAMLVQISETTAHAYNGYGGLTTYGAFTYPFEHPPHSRPLNISEPGHDLRRAHKRSYNTPLITREYRAVNAPLGSDYPAIRFLERNGFELHYATGADMGVPARARALLARSHAYLSVGHDEYWSYEQRAAIEAARDRPDGGLHLNFWSANEAYWAIRFERSRYDPPPSRRADTTAHVDVSADGTVVGATTALDDALLADEQEDPPRVLVCYKETQALTKLDPLPGAWTGTFRDARPLNPRGAMPENALSGTMFCANAHRVDALVVDGGRFGRHRAWWGTSVASMSFGQPPLALYPGVLGHEWDEDVDNGWRPPALQTLSTTTIHNVQAIVDYGATFDSATCTHSLVLHRRSSGALVFGAGTVQWSWGLDPTHDVNDPQRANKYAIRVQADPRGGCLEVQQLTVNVLFDMGMLPASLAPDLRLPPPSTDDQPPTGGVTTFRVKSSSRVLATGWAMDGGGGVIASVELSWDGLPPDAEGKRWHPTSLERLEKAVTWTFEWGDGWQRQLGRAPPHGHGAKSKLWLRIADDSGNLGLSEERGTAAPWIR